MKGVSNVNRELEKTVGLLNFLCRGSDFWWGIDKGDFPIWKVRGRAAV